MTSVSEPTDSGSQTNRRVPERLQTAFDNQRAASILAKRDRCGHQDREDRMSALAALQEGLQSHQEELLTAIYADFGGRSREEGLIFEFFALHSQINYARKHLKAWMRRRTVSTPWYLRPSRAFYQYQPLGVVGIIGAWNYPVLLALGPVIDALAAGNRVLLKPSDGTPHTAAVIAKLVTKYFDPERFACINGGREIGEHFTRLPFDHLLFTGSKDAAYGILQAAALNLTPVTLELGGKCPAVIHQTYPLDLAVDRIITGKLYNAGQTCVAPDYVLLPKGKEEAFESLARERVAQLYPALANNSDYTRIISRQHYDRISSRVEDSVKQGARAVKLISSNEDVDPETKVYAPTLIFEATGEMRIMRDEIFGPVLPVITYSSLDEAIAFVNNRPHPLALYYFDNNPSRIDDILRRTCSGGVTINDCIFHFGQLGLPFGGVGQSGMGQYHGFDGFVTFSKKRAVMVQRRLTVTTVLCAPFNKAKKWMIEAMLRIVTRRHANVRR
jgi:coniferyl-aldehyde dehydrogenase